MPQIGSCTDVTCDKEIKHLYECHCCSRLICLNHLIEHVEITKQNKERLDRLSKDLITVTATLKLIIKRKLIDIERENKLIEQAKQLLDVRICSLDEIENIFEDINQAIALNRSEEAIVKVEPPLLDIKNCSCVCKCDSNKRNPNDESSSRNTRRDLKSASSLDLTGDTDEAEKLVITKDNEYSMYSDHDFIDHIALDQTADPIQYEDEGNDQDTFKPKRVSSYFGQCPLTFDGAYGLTEAKHSVRFCSNKKTRPIGLYAHFVTKHELKAIYAGRLVEAIAKEQDPKTTKMFDENEDPINHFYKVPCPFNNGMINLFGCKKKILRVPCRHHLVIFSALKGHLKHYHHVPADLAQTLVNHFKEIRMKNHVI